MAEYFNRFIVPLAAVFISLRILVFLWRRLYPHFYVFFYCGYAENHHEAIKEQKDKLFADLSSLCKEDQRFLALEIGCGPGMNFGYYPPNTSLIVVEPNIHFQREVAKNAARHPKLEVTKFLCTGAEDLRKRVEDASQDAVVSTLTLCSVQDVGAVIGEVHRILKPGGRFFFIEHTKTHAEDTWSRVSQRILAPWVSFIAHCCITRTPWTVLDRAGFSHVKYTKTRIPALPLALSPHLVGYAVK